jgi:hypothetical protein
MNGELIPSYNHFLQAKLAPGETPLLFLEGALDGGKPGGCFILTDRRACFCRNDATGEDFKALRLATVHSLQMNSAGGEHTLALRGTEGAITFQTQESQELFDLVYRRVQSLMGGGMAPMRPMEPMKPMASLWSSTSPMSEVFDQLQAQIEDMAQTAQSAAEDEEPTGVAALEALERLAKLRDAGIVSDAEFAAKKRELLDRV